MDSAHTVDDQKKIMANGITSLIGPSSLSPLISAHNNINKDLKQQYSEPIYEALSNTAENKLKEEIITDIDKTVTDSKYSFGIRQTIQNDREQRRKFRVEKKLQEMHQHDIKKEVLNNDSNYNIIVFAENFFNEHERLIDGTLISTLTRKGKKVMDTIPKHEMITFTRSEKIPTSHIHMYDPENIVLSCNIFKVSKVIKIKFIKCFSN